MNHIDWENISDKCETVGGCWIFLFSLFIGLIIVTVIVGSILQVFGINLY